MQDFKKTKRTKVVRVPKRARYDRETVYAILDEALVCHVGFVADGQPYVLPLNHWRDGDRLYFHGSTGSRLLRAMAAGADLCVAVTLLDGLVLGRSAMHHSANYRSAIVFGRAEAVKAPADKLRALRAFMERIAPGRWEEVRPPSPAELRRTLVVGLPLIEASAKVRSGPPVDDEPDYALPVWAGELPVVQAFADPVPDRRLDPAIGVPAYLRRDDLSA